MDENLIQWHPGCLAAINLEFVQNKHDLQFYSEVELNTKPILIDVLIVKMQPEVEIMNEVGKIFKEHNIIEYKSPDDELNIDTFYKGISYASLYKTTGQTVNAIQAEQITLTFIRQRKPIGLFKALQENGTEIVQDTKGIYYVHGRFPYEIQNIVTRELDQERHIWLTSLSNNLSKEQAKTLSIALEN